MAARVQTGNDAGFTERRGDIMQKRIVLLVIVLLTSCASDMSGRQMVHYRETKASFFDLAHGDWTRNEWIRKPEHLKMVHETLKKVGYLQLIAPEVISSDEFLIGDVYIKRNLRVLFDSLAVTHGLDTIESRYYREFWERRKHERNDSIVYVIVTEISQVLRRQSVSYCPSCVNDTLYNLLRIQFRPEALTDDLALQDFHTLQRYGFHQSAYNILYERGEYNDIHWHKDSLVASLDTCSYDSGAWLEDTSK